MGHSLLFLFHQKKKAVEAHRLLVKTYGEHAPVIRTCETWFRPFKSGDFDLTDNEHPAAAKKVEEEELQAQTNTKCDPRSNFPTFKSHGKNPKVWKLNDRQMENRKTICEMLLQRFERKSFPHRIVTGDEKWIYFEYFELLKPGETYKITSLWFYNIK